MKWLGEEAFIHPRGSLKQSTKTRGGTFQENSEKMWTARSRCFRASLQRRIVQRGFEVAGITRSRIIQFVLIPAIFQKKKHNLK